MILKRILLAASTVALMGVPSIGFAQSHNPSPSATSDGNSSAPRARDRAGEAARNRVNRAAAPNAQARSRETAKSSARTAPAEQATGSRAPNNELTRERAARTAPAGQTNQGQGSTGEPASARAARATPQGRTAPQPSGAVARRRPASSSRTAQEQNQFRDLQNPRFYTPAPRWTRGERVPTQYQQAQYVVNDWRQRHLKAPPSGYRWVRNDYNDYFLVLISTGLISDVLYHDDFDSDWRQRYSRLYTYKDDLYYQECRRGPDPAGVLFGALIGGLLGHAIGQNGGQAAATLAGVIIGGAAGAALTTDLDCEDRSYAYRAYYDGFNAGQANALYRWRNPNTGHYGDFRVEDYFYDPDGFRCANYTQQIFINGRPQVASGHACQQPDGTWAIVG